MTSPNEADVLKLRIEAALIQLIHHGRDRCGSGFGKYPLGIREAVDYFLPLVPESALAQAALRDFDKRLAE